jgi:hypothetical protein
LTPIYPDRSDPISLSNSGAFYDVVYAPFAGLDLFNGSAIYGVILAKTVDLKISGNLYFDIALKDNYLAKDLAMSSWYEVRR